MYKIAALTEKLFADSPKGMLYHYTTLNGLLGIVRCGALWASDIRYMNDSAELRHAADLIHLEVQKRIAVKPEKTDLLNQFVDWVSHRITNGHMLFAASFRSQGNLLSQWRGYSTHGKGVSLGFSAEYIINCAAQQNFQIGKCIYEPARQRNLISQVVDAVEGHVAGHVAGNESRAKLAAVYRKVFEMLESDLLRISAILKHPSFSEEKEWRVVSPIFTDFTTSSVQFREAHAMLVPFINFALSPEKNRPLQLEHVFLGPTTNIKISMNSLRMFLTQNDINPVKGIDYCQIPYRQK